MDITALVIEQRNYFLSQVTKPVTFRQHSLKRLYDSIVCHQQEIMDALNSDLHKSEYEAFSTEIGFVMSEISNLIRKLPGWVQQKRVSTPVFMFPSGSKIIHEPYGLVLVVAPWNYPFQLVMSPLAGAIAAGNCVVVKPSPQAPATARVIDHIISDCFEPRYVSVVQGEKEVMGELLNQRFDYIFFTGSSSFGKHVMEAASRWLTPVTLELGGKSPCIVDNDANLPVAARRIAWGKFLNAGQTCVAPDYIYVHSAVKEKLLYLMKDEILHMFGSDPKKSSEYCRIVSQPSTKRLISFLRQGTIVFGGEYDIDEKYFAPTIIDNVKPDFAVMQEEIFGPVLPVMTFDDINEVINYLNHTEKPLALYYFSENKKSAENILRNTSSGGAAINDTIMHLANDKVPFGGVGNSGTGNYHGKYSFATFSHERAVISTPSCIDIKMRYPPYGDKIKLLKRIFK